ncbi:hypothetical protein RS9916_25894 [Synechococcus sp. RS9916]|nr:hypothetical protein RS9916_25894 [Synechococcus sp. RS9916]
MAKTIQRDAYMAVRIQLRCAEQDKELLRIVARKNGANVATLVRQSLIKQALVKP